MKRYFIYTAFVSFFTIFSLLCKAQDGERNLVADSLQRQKLKDSLQITNSDVDQIFYARDSMYLRLNAVRENNQVSLEVQNSQAVAIRNETNHRIETILGHEKYLHYLAIIRNNLSSRNTRSAAPLAGASDN